MIEYIKNKIIAGKFVISEQGKGNKYPRIELT